MWCAIYKSIKREETYLFLEKRDDFSRVPNELLQSFGTPQLVMLFPLDGSHKLVSTDVNKMKIALLEQGFYLQIPPPKENLLKQHRADLQLKVISDTE
ncbi:MAG: YcgL domain-containing protein [Plesiomonas sp.]|uniref:YcgL domain-containing protein n=1 Tax=Plesiomonas sp. TaxID=2486279 RepID=UPI003F2AE804